MKKLLGVLIAVATISGCQATAEQAQTEKEQTEQIIVPAPISKKSCKPSMSPPIKDKTKIKNMLEKSGRITAQMAPEKVNKIVNDYIRKKRSAFISCQKKG